MQDRLAYQSFAEILALELGNTTETRRRRAERAGWRWGGRIVATSPQKPAATHDIPDAGEPSEILDRQTAMTAKIFERMGFNAELIPAAQSTTGKRQRTILLQGHVRLTAGSDAWEGETGDYLTIPPQRHALKAIEDSVIILTVAVPVASSA